jgi:hypothetical protein
MNHPQYRTNNRNHSSINQVIKKHHKMAITGKHLHNQLLMQERREESGMLIPTVAVNIIWDRMIDIKEMTLTGNLVKKRQL